MKYTGLNELREKFLSFFESKGHLRLPSASLVPQGDKSLLLINCGMAPMKPYFSGDAKPPSKRVTNCQKCVRVIDIEQIGKTSRHCTYFEMLGHFSFGDYFKREALEWTWEFYTEIMGIDPQRLYPSVFKEDDEAYDIWTKEMGVDPARVVRLGREDNFWDLGSGPCGPSSEIYFDRGAAKGCGKLDCGPGCDCDRFIEIGNNVFTQFNNDGAGNYSELSQKNIDFGGGLERLALVMQGVDSVHDIDTIQNITRHVVEIAGVKYGASEKDDVSLRIISDHIRSTVMLVCDGVVPSNEGRGYVLRRLLRRAARHGKLLGIKKPFLCEVAGTVIRESGAAYPELIENRERIEKVIRAEEERFNATIDAGLGILETMTAKPGTAELSGADAFKLYDTYGFPLDLTKEILEERGIAVDEAGFAALMEEQRVRARNARGGAAGWKGDGASLTDVKATIFTGYNFLTEKVVVTAIIVDGERVDCAEPGQEAIICLDKSPLYARSGGQAGDTGALSAPGFAARIDDTTKTDEGVYLHHCDVTDGEVKVGDTVTVSVDAARRGETERSHTAAHLLQAALRKVLGDHVTQAGSQVDHAGIRFDFHHSSAMTRAEIEAVEDLVNRWILDAADVVTVETGIGEAKAMGAIALFGEKYGDVVRVVRSGEVSAELCGGTHVKNTSNIGSFRILREGSVAAGVRRIEGVAGLAALSHYKEDEVLLRECADVLKLNDKKDMPGKIKELQDELRATKKAAADAENKAAMSKIGALIESLETHGGAAVGSARLDGIGADALRALCDRIKEVRPDAAFVVGALIDGKPMFCAVCGKEAVALGANAGQIAKAAAAATGGNGGGRPDSAYCGGRDADKLGEGIAAGLAALKAMVKND